MSKKTPDMPMGIKVEQKSGGRKISPGDPIRSHFRTPKEYALLLGDVFVVMGKRNMRPFDWAVFSRVMGHIAVRQFEAGFKLQETVEDALKVAGEIGDTTFKLALNVTSKMQAPGERSVKTPMSALEKEIDNLKKN